ncbi:MAG: hypothetical protein IKA53_01845 [Clostridia bacterium]|nr:hypothetical protein [Clostridia bacterium]
MHLENLAVKHKAFGNGVILAQSEKYITVRFATAEKIFVYPDAFEKFLTMEDGSVPSEILEDLEASRAAKDKVLKAKRDENVRSMMKGIVIPGKEIVIENKDDEPREEMEEI